MNIIDQKRIMRPSWEVIIKEAANIPFKLECFGCLEDIHRDEKIDVIIEHETKSMALLHQEARRLLMKELENNPTDKRKEEIVRLLNSISQVVVLGEYKPKENNIYLYINTIKSCGKDFEKTILTTYIHEMMHAYFNRRGHKHYPYIYEIEEAMAEAGMLLFLDKTHNPNLDWAFQDVKDKSPVLKEYAHGAILYEQWKLSQIDLEMKVEKYKDYVMLNIQSTRHIRDRFEDWLIGFKGKAPSSAAYYACYFPLLKPIKDSVYEATNFRTECLFDVVSTNEINSIRNVIWNYCKSYNSHKRSITFLTLYEEYLISTNQNQP